MYFLQLSAQGTVIVSVIVSVWVLKSSVIENISI